MQNKVKTADFLWTSAEDVTNISDLAKTNNILLMGDVSAVRDILYQVRTVCFPFPEICASQAAICIRRSHG